MMHRSAFREDVPSVRGPTGLALCCSGLSVLHVAQQGILGLPFALSEFWLFIAWLTPYLLSIMIFFLLYRFAGHS